ncbi:hypothetical protein LB465_14240 [Salegentibacter sp. LM13S]|uniref:hypothetical protein n=1 Tax=Salegentibacter lacus TaxID=2873599 RepID=UPI001CCCC91D|nr:hypothetical protein [Salegentibacter lacus]MBZ9631945.1 hypothetical protein [Salegentibacter lacus]
MRVFDETQSFRQWWLILIAIFCISLPFAFVIDDILEGQIKDYTIELITTLIILSVFIMLYNLRLYTRIDQKGIKTWWEPFHLMEKEFLWKDLEKVFIRKYRPLQEYGGWGIRGLGKKRAYNVSGYTGIQLVNSNGGFLIGTQKPIEAKSVIKRYSL